jgi:hypothetical protein
VKVLKVKSCLAMGRGRGYANRYTGLRYIHGHEREAEGVCVHNGCKGLSYLHGHEGGGGGVRGMEYNLWLSYKAM